MPDIVVEILPEVTDIEVIVSPETELNIVVEVIPGYNGGASHIHVYNETPNGVINGSNATFTSLSAFVPESLVITVNGVAQKPGVDYTTTGTSTAIFIISPQVGDNILFNYIRA